MNHSLDEVAGRAAVAPLASRRESAAVRGWPAWLFAALVLGAAGYAFSPRSIPPFPPSVLHTDRLLVTGLARSGSRILATAELGHILVADRPHGPWREARVEPERGSTLTRIAFVGPRLALAVGQDSWILRSTDDGQSWREVHFDPARSEPLLGVAGPYDGKLYAFGSFGQMLVSSDEGQTWTEAPLDILPVAGTPPAKPQTADADNPFAAFSANSGGNDLAGRHLYAMTRAADGALWLVGERGLLLRSDDGGARWQAQPTIYQGSFYGVLALPDRTLVVFGMRGHAYYSRDLGKSWRESEVPVPDSLFGGAVDARGRPILVGDDNSVLRSDDGGAHFFLAAQAAHHGLVAGLAAVLPLPDGEALTAGDEGIAVRKLADPSAALVAAPTGAQP